MAVPDLLRARATSAPGAVALMVEDRRQLTYGEWDRYSDTTAAGLAAKGVGRGDVIGLAFDTARWDAFAVAYIGVHKAGAAAVPLVAGPGLGGLLEHSEALGVICPPDLSPSIAAAGTSAWISSLADLKGLGGPGAFVGPALDGAALAEIIYTSGTTGTPKGVACSHASVVVHDGPPEPEGPLARVLHAFPVGTNACQELLRLSLRRADRIPVAMAAFDPERCARLVAQLRVERLQLVPAMAGVLVESGAHIRHDMSCVEVITLSSAPTTAELVDRLSAAFPLARLVNAYALTESGTARTLNLDLRSGPDSVGRPVGATELRVVDGAGRDVHASEPGEIWMRRPGAAQRWYHRDPQASAAAWAGGWLHTGDQGWLGDGGELHLVDRLKDIVICGGLNVSTLEVEEVLISHPQVVEVAVLGVPHDVLGQDVGAAVVTSGDLDTRELQAFARQRLAEHKVPHRIALVEALPRTPSGKVQKADLLAAVLAGSPSAGSPRRSDQAPATPAQEAIAALWCEVLGVGEVGINDDFFELGGHSLAAARLLARIAEDLGATIALATLFEGPTVAELASAVSGSSG